MLTLDSNENFNQYKIDSIKSTVLANTSVLIKENLHLSRPQKELLLWHWKLGHANMRWIQSLFKPRNYIDTDGNKLVKDPIVMTSHDSTSTVQIPVCEACQLGKQKSRGGGTTKTRKLVNMKLKINILEPGQMVSTDQFISR